MLRQLYHHYIKGGVTLSSFVETERSKTDVVNVTQVAEQGKWTDEERKRYMGRGRQMLFENKVLLILYAADCSVEGCEVKATSLTRLSLPSNKPPLLLVIQRLSVLMRDSRAL